MMTRNRYSVAFVTGGASGIGLAITKQLLERGDCVAVCDKSHLALQENKEALQRWGISRLDVSFHQVHCNFNAKCRSSNMGLLFRQMCLLQSSSKGRSRGL